MVWWKFGKKTETLPGKKQPDYYDGKASGVDFAAPSLVKETIPGEVSTEGVKISDYAVEIGGTVAPARYFRSFFAEIAAGNTWAGMLDSLIVGDFGQGDVDLAIHVRPSSSDRELNEIARRIAGLLSDLSDEKDVRKIDAIQDELQDLKERQQRIRLNVERSFRVAIQVIASAPDWKVLTRLGRSLVQRFAGKSIFLRSTDGQQLAAIQSVLPTALSTDVPKERFLSLETSNVADLFPFGNGGLDHRTGIIIGKDTLKRPVWLDNWHPELTNNHTCLVGRSGAGKTQATMIKIHRSMHIGRKAAVIDWKGEYGDLFNILDCPYIGLGERSEHRINPYDLDVTELLDGTRYLDIESSSNAVQGLVFKMISTYDRAALTGEVKVYIGQTIRDQYLGKGITTDPSSLFFKNGSEADGIFRTSGRLKSMPTLGDLFERMKDDTSEAVRKAAELLKPFTRFGNSPSYAIFDAASTVEIDKAPGFGIDIHLLDAEIMRPVGLFVATRWTKERWANKHPEWQKFIVIEECQNILGDPDIGPVWAESAYREARSSNTGMVAVTQGLEVFTQSKAGIAALKNSPVKIIGIQETLDIQSVQGKLALTEGEADFLVYKARKGDFLVKVDNQSSIVQIHLSPFEKMMFTTDPNDPLYRQRKEYMRERARRQTS